MSVQLICRETPIARKAHICKWCGERIDAGQQYVRSRVVVDGDAATQKLHSECDKALQELARAEGGTVYFDPWSMPRGAQS